MEEMADGVRGDLFAEKVYMRTLHFKDLSRWLQNEMRLVSVYKMLTKTLSVLENHDTDVYERFGKRTFCLCL